jgi:hypothetical protein
MTCPERRENIIFGSENRPLKKSNEGWGQFVVADETLRLRPSVETTFSGAQIFVSCFSFKKRVTRNEGKNAHFHEE